MQASRNSSVLIELKYDVLQQDYSPYKNQLDIGITFIVGW